LNLAITNGEKLTSMTRNSADFKQIGLCPAVLKPAQHPTQKGSAL
jgi:hypothetical protein